jgi:hypothetical protein
LSRVGSREVLRGLVADTNPGIREMAILSLAKADPEVQERDLYAQECQRANPSAFDALARKGDPFTAVLMRTILEAPEKPNSGGRASMAKRVLQKQEILLAPDWEAKVASVLIAPQDAEWGEWAADVSSRASSSRLAAAFRERLDTSVKNGRARFDRQRQSDTAEGFDPESRSFDEIWCTTGKASFIFDDSYDQVLLAYWQSGGRLTSLETRRLNHFGYGAGAHDRLKRIAESN